MKFSLAQQIQEIDREIELRKGVYPRQVQNRKMSQSTADFHMARIEAARDTLLWLEKHEATIRRALGEVKAS